MIPPRAWLLLRSAARHAREAEFLPSAGGRQTFPCVAAGAAGERQQLRWATIDGGGGSGTSDDLLTASGRTVSPITRQLWEKRERMASMLDKPEGTRKEQEEFPPKAPEFHGVTFPFSRDPQLVEQYRNPWGFVRAGRILEDLDSLAGNIAYQHCDDNDPETPPPLLVTAGVEKITLNRQMRLDKDMVLGGRVVWVGKSSMDIRMEVIDSDGQDCLVAHFFFVARSPFTKKSMRVNPLEPVTALDRELFLDGEKRAMERKARSKRELSPAEQATRQQWIGDMMEKAQAAEDMPALVKPGWIWKRDTSHENMLMCQPQQRNMAGRIFGGFLMRRAFELAFTTCYSFAGSRPAFLLVDDISFKQPVDVGDLLRLNGYVVHVEHKEGRGPPWLGTQHNHAVVHVQVTAAVVKPEQASSHITNTFHFRFAVDNSERSLKCILPSTRDEAEEMYMAASQHFAM